MKRTGTIFAAALLISACFISQPAGAQDKTKEDKEKELKVEEEIQAQKKAFNEQKKAQEDMMKSMEIQKKSIEKAMKDAQDQYDFNYVLNDSLGRRFGRHFTVPDINVDIREPFFNVGDEPFIGHSLFGDRERTSWDFSKSVKESSFSRDYTFDVETSANTVVMSVNGDCKDGSIRIRIVMPNGKTYSDIVIDESGNLNWRKSFTVSEEENKDKTGAWKFEINASKATGYFKISLQTY